MFQSQHLTSVYSPSIVLVCPDSFQDHHVRTVKNHVNGFTVEAVDQYAFVLSNAPEKVNLMDIGVVVARLIILDTCWCGFQKMKDTVEKAPT